jgi:hypothetical protein
VWWAAPLLALVAGTLAFRVLATLRFAATGHTLFLHYTAPLYSMALVVAGVLVLVHAVPLALRRIGTAPPPGTVAALVAVALAWVCYNYGGAWLPGTNMPTSHYAADIQQEPLPDGGYSRFALAAGRTPWFPVGPVQKSVEKVLGPNPHKVTLSVDERLFAYLPWPGYVTTSRAASGSMVLWDDRVAGLRRLAATTDPAAFAHDSAHTRFGPIDIFVLKRVGDYWTWRDVKFSASQFDPAVWAVDTSLPEDTVVAVRR